MKKLNFYALAVLCLFGISSCITARSYLKTNSPVHHLSPTEVSVGTLQAKYEIKGEVSAEVTDIMYKKRELDKVGYVIDINQNNLPSSVIDAMGAAMNKALKESECDILLAPIYTLEVKNGLYFGVKVKGFGAVISGVEQIFE